MSSYVASPYTIEDRRLSGIVNQCRTDLNNAMEDLRRQQEAMREQERKKAEEDAMYFVRNQAERQRQQSEDEKARKAEALKRAELKRELAELKLQLDVYEKHYGQLATAAARQQRLTFALEEGEVSLNQLEKEIKGHQAQTKAEIRQKSSEAMQRMMQREVMTQKVVRKETAVSLQLEEEEGRKRTTAPSKADLFAQKLQEAMASSYAMRIPDLAAMKREYDAQPAYAKTAFAARNAARLEKILERLAALDEQNKGKAQEVGEILLRYESYCKLLGRKADPRMRSNKVNALALEKMCNELERIYLEQQKRAYVSEALATVMERHGIEYQDAGAGNQLLFAMENAELSVSMSGTDYLNMEVAGEYSGATPNVNDKRKGVAAAASFCSMLKEIQEELRTEFGIEFNHVTVEEPDEATIRMKRASNRSSKKYHSSQKAMEMK